MALDAENPDDDDRLLPGESMSSASPDEAVHWIAVYSELAQFLQSGGPQFAPELVERYQRRLDFWIRKLQELAE